MFTPPENVGYDITTRPFIEITAPMTPEEFHQVCQIYADEMGVPCPTTMSGSGQVGSQLHVSPDYTVAGLEYLSINWPNSETPTPLGNDMYAAVKVDKGWYGTHASYKEGDE